MKELIAFLFLIMLISVGWKQPYRAHFSSVAGNPPPVLTATAPASSAPATAEAATPARENSWMWQKTSMDAPHAPINDDKGGGKRGR